MLWTNSEGIKINFSTGCDEEYAAICRICGNHVMAYTPYFAYCKFEICRICRIWKCYYYFAYYFAYWCIYMQCNMKNMQNNMQAPKSICRTVTCLNRYAEQYSAMNLRILHIYALPTLLMPVNPLYPPCMAPLETSVAPPR